MKRLLLRVIIVSGPKKLILQLWEGSKSLETCSPFWGSSFSFLGLHLPVCDMQQH